MSDDAPALRERIPDRIEDLTPSWLTGALRERGLLGDGWVRDVKHEVLGVGEGFMGVVARLHLYYEGERGIAPLTLIAKLPTDVAQNRIMGEVLGAYWREIHFYEEQADAVPVTTPRLYHAALTPDPRREKQDEILALLDRVPGWLIGALEVLSRWIVKRNAHRYVLLIEDLAPAEIGDQVAGARPDDLRAVLERAAALHARYWESEELGALFWLARQDAATRMRHRLYKRSRKAFARRYEKLLDDELWPAVHWLDKNGARVTKALHSEAPKTFLHCDLRYDNIFFDPGRRDPVIFADWQLAGSGAAAYDVAYLISSALPSDADSGVESALLRAYHEALVRGGVSGYTFERFRRDYARGLFVVLMVLATTDAVELGEERGVRMMDLWVERTLSRLRPVDTSTLLGA